jgi:peptide/nickel transport system substrate-binding protein
MPRHLLGSTYESNPDALLELPYWSREFVGTGPFQLTEFVEGSHLAMQAYDAFALGRPKIDRIEVRFVSSSQTLIASVIADAVDLMLGRGLSLQEAATLKERWPNGTVYSVTDAPRSLVPQHLDPTPAIVGNVQFRRALAHAIDRHEMAATLGLGLSPVADVGIPLEDPMYKAVEPALVRYEFDPGKAIAMIEALGYAKGADGLFRDPTNQLLQVNLRSSEREVNVNVILSAAAYWNRLGVSAQTEVVPLAESTANRGKYALFPAFQTGGGNFAGLNRLDDLRPERVPNPENGYLGPNTGRYVNPELIALIDRYYVTIPMPERVQTLQAIYRIITDQVVSIPLYYDATPAFVSNRLVGVAPGYFGNAYLWDVRS